MHEVHSLKRRAATALKRRAATATRPVPIPPQFVRILREHVDRSGVAPDRRLFRNQAGNYVDAAAYGTTWGRARKCSPVRPLGLWSGQAALRSSARRELFRHYAKFLESSGAGRVLFPHPSSDADVTMRTASQELPRGTSATVGSTGPLKRDLRAGCDRSSANLRGRMSQQPGGPARAQPHRSRAVEQSNAGYV